MNSLIYRADIFSPTYVHKYIHDVINNICTLIYTLIVRLDTQFDFYKNKNYVGVFLHGYVF